MNINDYMETIGIRAKKSSYQISYAPKEQKNEFLIHLGHQIISKEVQIISANKKDLVIAKENGLDNAFIDR